MLTTVRWLALASYAAIALLIIAWQVSGGGVNLPLLALVLLPLLLPLPGLLRGNERAHVWASLVSLLYLLHGMVTVTGPAGSMLYGYLEIGLALCFLVTASLWLKWRQRLAAQP